jgi:hypothetical protein
MKRLALLLVVLAAAGCASLEKRTPLHPTAHREEFTVRIVALEPEQAGMACAREHLIHGWAGRALLPTEERGCSSFDPKANRLTMIVPSPRYLEDEERFFAIGHELWHGYAGHFHD